MDKDVFIWEMWHLSTELQKTRYGLTQEFCKKYGLTHQQLRILLEIRNSQTTTLTDLAEKININPGNLSKACKSLEEKKYIKRVRHDEDKRVWTIQLAKKGKDITELIANHIEDVFNVFSKKHEAAELEQVLVLLREYVQYYKDIEKKSR